MCTDNIQVEAHLIYHLDLHGVSALIAMKVSIDSYGALLVHLRNKSHCSRVLNELKMSTSLELLCVQYH